MAFNNLPAAYCLTDIGKKRRRNEDACKVCPEHHFFLVADGIGGAAAGNVASTIFAKTTAAIFQNNIPRTLKQCKQIIERCFLEANQRIREYVRNHPECRGMGCTAELLALFEDNFLLGHVGDSRTYIVRNNNYLEQLTHDHSLVQKQVEQGIMSQLQAERSTIKNILLRAVGVEEQLEVDIIYGEALPGTTFLLCTDGLHNMLSSQQILPVIQYSGPLSLKAEMLVNMANDAGGKDNITVALVELI